MPQKTHNIYILNGPNLNLLGVREPKIYGRVPLREIQQRCETVAASLGLTCDFRQSNHEGELIEWIHEARERSSGVIINPTGYSFYSIVLLDALKAVDLPIIEIHISNIFRRESYYHDSIVSFVATGVICGFGAYGYEMAIHAMAEQLRSSRPVKKAGSARRGPRATVVRRSTKGS
jgi:3-dehydroquinate dehydratase-2